MVRDRFCNSFPSFSMMNLSSPLLSFATMEAGLPDHSGLWGFARAVRMEYPGMPWLYSPWSVVGFVKVETILELLLLLLLLLLQLLSLSLYWLTKWNLVTLQLWSCFDWVVQAPIFQSTLMFLVSPGALRLTCVDLDASKVRQQVTAGNTQSWGGLFWLRRSYVSHV